MTCPLESDFATFYSQSQREILFIFQSKTKMFGPLSQLLLCQGGFSCYKENKTVALLKKSCT